MLDSLGLCAIYYTKFDEALDLADMIELIPYYMKLIEDGEFYDCDGFKTGDSSQFWFPRGQNEGRIAMLREIIAKMES
jgi:hypothetical protein